MMERKLLNLQSNESLSISKGDPLLRLNMTSMNETNGSLTARDNHLPAIESSIHDKDYYSSLSARSKYEKNKKTIQPKKVIFHTSKIDLSDTLESMIDHNNLLFQEEKIDDIVELESPLSQKKNKAMILSPNKTESSSNTFINNNNHHPLKHSSPPIGIQPSNKLNKNQQKAFPKGRILKQYEDENYDFIHSYDKYNIRPTRIQKPMPGNSIVPQQTYNYQHINNSNNNTESTSISKALPIRFKIKPYSSNTTRRKYNKLKPSVDDENGNQDSDSYKQIIDDKIHVNINMRNIIPIINKVEQDIIPTTNPIVIDDDIDVFPKAHLLDEVKIHESLKPKDKGLDNSRQVNELQTGENSNKTSNKSKPIVFPMPFKQQELVIPSKPLKLNPVAARLFHSNKASYIMKVKIPQLRASSHGVSTRNNTSNSTYQDDSMVKKIRTTFMLDPFSKTQTLASTGGIFKLEIQPDFKELVYTSNEVASSITEDMFQDVEHLDTILNHSVLSNKDDVNDSNLNNMTKFSNIATEIINASKIKPLDPLQFINNKSWIEILTSSEQIEILQYPNIYFAGRNIDVKSIHNLIIDKQIIDDNTSLESKNIDTKENFLKEELNLNNLNNKISSSDSVIYDTEKGNYNVSIGDHISFQYEVLQILGNGSFGDVYKCYDYKTSKHIAMKIIKNKKHFIDSSKQEKKILELIHKDNKDNDTCIIKLMSTLEFRNHPCFIFPIYGKNLYEYLQYKNFQGLPISFIKKVAIQLLKALDHIHKLGIIHCDLKPENILIQDENQCTVVLIDFGSSCFVNETPFSYLQSRFYRAPEILLGLPYGTAIDIWSLGCILAELRSGYPAFPGENNSDQISCIAEVLGMPSNEVYDKSNRQTEHFNQDKQLIIRNSPRGKNRIISSRTVKQLINARNKDDDFVDFLNHCFTWLSDHRLNAMNGLNHTWLQNKKHISLSSNLDDDMVDSSNKNHLIDNRIINALDENKDLELESHDNIIQNDVV